MRSCLAVHWTCPCAIRRAFLPGAPLSIPVTQVLETERGGIWQSWGTLGGKGPTWQAHVLPKLGLGRDSGLAQRVGECGEPSSSVGQAANGSCAISLGTSRLSSVPLPCPSGLWNEKFRSYRLVCVLTLTIWAAAASDPVHRWVIAGTYTSTDCLQTSRM